MRQISPRRHGGAEKKEIRIIVRIPCRSMVKDTLSGSIDSSSRLRRSESLRMTRS
jgi:hypothetical protein